MDDALEILESEVRNITKIRLSQLKHFQKQDKQLWKDVGLIPYTQLKLKAKLGL